MSINEQFVEACKWLEGAGPSPVTSIDVVYYHHYGPMERPCLFTMMRRKSGASHTIYDTDMDVANWRRYGNLVKTNKTVEGLMCIVGGRGDIQLNEVPFDEINHETAHCLEAFFERLKDNTTIEEILLDPDLSTKIPPLALRHFFQNNKRLEWVGLFSSTDGDSISPQQSIHLSTVLRDIPLKTLHIGCRFINNGSIEHILSACRRVNVLWMNRDRHHQFLYDNYVFTALAEVLRDPTTKWQELCVQCINNPSLDAQRAENDILSSLTQNAQLKTLKVYHLFQGDEAVECFASILCDATSIESILQSNHTVEAIRVDAHAVQDPCHQYLELNKNLDKRKVAQIKIMQYYLSKKFEASPLPSMPLAVLPQVLGIDVPKRHKCTAVFNIFKGIPELCNVSSRNEEKR